MENSPNDPKPDESDEDLEILDRILQEEQSKWEATAEADVEDDFYIFEEEEEPAEDLAPVPAERLLAHRFRVLQELSSGERGTLFDVLDDQGEGERLRLRVLSPEWLGAAPMEDFLARTEQVREATAALEHPAILPFQEVGLDDEGRFWLTYKTPGGESLAQLMERSGALPPAHALEIVAQLLEALEHAAAQGLFHGALDAESIWLAPKLGWSAENPFAVGVRVHELGLSNLSRSGNEERDDLYASARLLAQLLTGEAFDPGQSSWASSSSADKSIGLSEPLGVLLDTSLDEDPGERYQSAAAFRAALERVEEYRPKPMARKRSLLSNMILVATIGAVLYGTKERWWPAAKSRAQDNSIVDTSQAEIDALRAQAELRIAEELALKEATARDLAAALAAQEALQQEQQKEKAELQEIVEAERLAREAALQEREAALEAERLKSGEVDSLTEDLQNSQARIKELETAAEKRIRLAKESDDAEALALVSGQVERMLRALEEGNLINARQVAEELAENPLVREAPLPLTPFYTDLFDAHDGLAALDSRTDPFERVGLLEPASLAVQAARLSGRPVMTGDNASELLDDPDRIAGYQSCLDSLDERLQEQRDRLTSQFAALWETTLEQPDLDPALVLQRASVLDDPQSRMLEFIQSYASFLREHALPYDVLALDKLDDIESLEAWNARLAELPIQGAQAEAELLANLSFARSFYQAGEWQPVPQRLRARVISPPWLERLALSAAILESQTGMRAAIGTRLLYHSRTEAGEESWRWDTIQEDLNPPAGVDDSRIILQEFLDAEGNKRGQRTLRMYRIGLRLYEGDARPTELLNLNLSGPAYAIYPWHASEAPALPTKLGIAPGAFEAFRARLKLEPWRTLIVEEGRQTTLWTRELGLVRHTIPGRITYELVFAE